MKKLFKNGVIVTEKETKRADLLISRDKITAIAIGIMPEPGTEVIDAEGLFILPGGVDVHVHLDLPMFGTVSSDDHYTGTKAAAFGGTTTVIDFISQDSDNLAENFRILNHKAAE